MPRVSHSYIMTPAAFLSCIADEHVPMNIEQLDYAQLSEAAMAAAEGAASLEECQAHLAQAVRYASLACMEHRRSPDFNVVPIRPGASAALIANVGLSTHCGHLIARY